MTGRRTYWHLETLDRVPDDYDIATSRLQYHSGRGFEVRTPVGDWFARFQHPSSQSAGLLLSDWEAFSDPRRTTYTRYTEIQKNKEAFVDGLLRTFETGRYEARLPAPWIETLDRVLPAVRFPLHGLQMAIAYLGSLAPAGRITICCALQAADEVRRIQRIAQRLGQLQNAHPHIGEQGRQQWQEDPRWQPLRRVVERLLVTFDWSEAFVALNLALKPALDRLLNAHWAGVAERNGDFLLSKLLSSLDEDAHWHRQWSLALMQTAFRQSAENRRFVGAALDRWQPLVEDAGRSMIGLLQGSRADQAVLEEVSQAEFAQMRRELEDATGGGP